VITEYDLFECGDDVTFGSRSTYLMTSAHGSRPIRIQPGANVADRCVLAPGVVVGRNAVLGSGTFAPEGFVAPAGSTWIGQDGREAPIELEAATPRRVEAETLRPYGRAMYSGEASYRVWPLAAHMVFNVSWAVLCALYRSAPMTAALLLTRAALAEDQMRQILVPTIVGDWREAVLRDVAAEPFTPAEDAVRGGDDPTIAYGTTLLLAIALGDWLLLAQIGDGDIVGIRPDGTATLPVPGDPQLDGRHTTSLCTVRAEHSFRVAAVDTALSPLLGVLMATDGYGNAQVARDWEDVVSADLAPLIGSMSASWLASQLPEWAQRCASLDGSADDTTIALLLAPGAAAAADGPEAEGTAP